MHTARYLRVFLSFSVMALSASTLLAVDPISLSQDALKAKVQEILTSEIQAGRIVLTVDPQQPSLAQILSELQSSEHPALLQDVNEQVTTQIANVIAQRLLQWQATIFHEGATHTLKSQLFDLQKSKALKSEQRGVKSLQDYIGLALKGFDQKNDHVQKQIIQTLIPKIILHPDQKLEVQVNLYCLNPSDCEGRKKVRTKKWRTICFVNQTRFSST